MRGSSRAGSQTGSHLGSWSRFGWGSQGGLSMLARRFHPALRKPPASGRTAWEAADAIGPDPSLARQAALSSAWAGQRHGIARADGASTRTSAATEPFIATRLVPRPPPLVGGGSWFEPGGRRQRSGSQRDEGETARLIDRASRAGGLRQRSDLDLSLAGRMSL